MPARHKRAPAADRPGDTVRTRFVALFTVPLLLAALALLAFFSARMDTLGKAWAQRKATGIASVLASSVEPGLDFNDAALIRDLLQRLKPELAYAAVLREDGSLLAGLRPKLRPPSLPTPGAEPVVHMQDERLHVVTRLRARGGAKGTLVFGLSLATLKQEQKTNLMVVGGASACLLLVGIAFSVLGSTYLRRRRRAEEALLRSEASFRVLIESLPDAICVQRGERLVYASPRTTRYLGIGDREALVERSILDLVHPDDRGQLDEILERLRPGAVEVLDEVRFVKEGGKEGDEIVQAEVTVLSLIFDGEPATVLIVRDLTERKQMQARLLIADRMASVGTLAAGVAHEINNPLTYVMSNISYTIEQLKAADASPAVQREILQALTEALEGAHRVSHIVGDLKTFSRSDEDTVAPVELREVLESSINIAWNEIRHRATLQKDFCAAPRVLANESRLGQVFINLLVNAVQALPADDIADNEIRVSVRTQDDGQVAVEISDNGCGIPPRALKRLFDPFFTTKPVGQGTGLGLAICHSIIDSLGGEIVVKSQVGKGSTFRVVLPSAKGVATGAEERAPEEVTEVRRGRILVVDDEPEVGAVVKRALAGQHEVVFTTSGKIALSLLGASAFDVVLCDVMMPELSGMDLYRELERDAPHLLGRITFITGGAFTEAAAEFVKGLPNKVLEKPFAPDELRRVVSEQIHALDAGTTPSDAVAV